VTVANLGCGCVRVKARTGQSVVGCSSYYTLNANDHAEFRSFGNKWYVLA
jgi:hypothetical protein